MRDFFGQYFFKFLNCFVNSIRNCWMKRLKLKKSIFNTFEPSNLRFRAKVKATRSKFSTFFNERLHKNVFNRIQSFPQFKMIFPINKKILYSFPLLHKTFIYPNSKFNLISNSKFCRSLWFHWKVLFVKCFAVVINFHGIYWIRIDLFN